LNRVNADIFSSSVISIEGHVYAVVMTDDCTGFQWLYGMRTKDKIIKVFRKWYNDNAVLRNMHNFLFLVRDNAGENKSQELNVFFESKDIQNYFSTPYEQWQNGLAESSINSL
jgi:hypothetical protein